MKKPRVFVVGKYSSKLERFISFYVYSTYEAALCRLLKLRVDCPEYSMFYSAIIYE